MAGQNVIQPYALDIEVSYLAAGRNIAQLLFSAVHFINVRQRNVCFPFKPLYFHNIVFVLRVGTWSGITGTSRKHKEQG